MASQMTRSVREPAPPEAIPVHRREHVHHKIDLSHVVQWPPQPTTIIGAGLVGFALIFQPEIAIPALISGFVAILGDDGTGRG